MAVIKCNDCSGMVSDRADACPHCGFPMVERLPWYARPSRNRRGEGLFLRTLNTITGFILAVVGACAVYLIWFA